MTEQNNEQLLEFKESEKTISPSDALKSKSNFEQYIYENQTDVFNLFQDIYQPIRIISAQLTQSHEGLVNLFQHLKKLPKKAQVNTNVALIWIVANEKELWLDLVSDLNNWLCRECSFYIIKASVEEEKMNYTILAEPQIRRRRNKMTDTKQLQKEYWQRYAEICDAEGNPDFQVEAYPRHFQYIPIGKSGVQIVQTINTPLKMVASELFINNDIDKKIFDKIYTHKEDIEAELENVDWQRNEGKKSARIRVCVNLDITEKNNWDEAIKEQLKMAEKIAEVMRKYL